MTRRARMTPGSEGEGGRGTGSPGQPVSTGHSGSAAPGVPAPGVSAIGLPAIDTARIEAAVREILLALGEDPTREGLLDTPARVARAYAEQFAGLRQDPTEVLGRTFEIDHEEMILVRDIEVYSTCEHHLVPFHGVAHVAYIPGRNGRVVGLSKIARLVDVYARRPQVQERLTTQVAHALLTRLGARGVLVVVECEHLCMSMRGVRKPGAMTVTSAVRGQLRDPAT